jgi:hypothetical protein
MTDKTETAKQVSTAGGRLAASVLGTLGFLALAAWLAGVALNKGYGVHVPFVATWLLLLVGFAGVLKVTSEVASGWHSTRVKADINLLAASMAAQEEIRKEQSSGLASLLDSLGKTDDKGTGAYL